MTGVITLNEAGHYVIEWWAVTQSTTANTATAFSLSSSLGEIIQGMSPVKAGQLSGFGIVDVTAAPVTVTLTNATGGTIYFPSNAAVQAGMMVSGFTTAFGGRMSQISTFNVPGSVDPIEMPLAVTATESVNVDYSVPNAITIEQAGIYRVDISFVGAISGIGMPSQNFAIGLYRNGLVTPESGLIQTVAMVENQYTTFAVSNYVRFEQGDVLRLGVSTAPDDVTVFFPVTGPGVTLMVQRVM